MSEMVCVNRSALEALADYVADDLKHHMDDESEYLYQAVKHSYDVIDKDLYE